MTDTDACTFPHKTLVALPVCNNTLFPGAHGLEEPAVVSVARECLYDLDDGVESKQLKNHVRAGSEGAEDDVVRLERGNESSRQPW